VVTINSENSEIQTENKDEQGQEKTGMEKRLSNLKPFKPNNPETGERDERINRNGAPRKGKAISEQIALAVEMTVGDVLKIVGRKSRFGKRLASFPADMTMKQLIAVMSALDAALNPNQAKVLNLITTRLEGKESDKGYGDDNTSEFKPISLPAENIPANFTDLYRDILNHGHTEYLLRGGRSSGKSTTLALILIVLFVNDPECNILVTRQVADTLRSSCYNTLKYAISTLGLDDDFHATLSPLEINYKDGRKIFFRGLDAPEKLKSLRSEKGKIKIVWFEEVTEVKSGQEGIRNVVQSAIRGTDEGTVFLSYNPPRQRNAWINKYSSIPRSYRYDHYSCYLDLPKEWVGKAFMDQAEHLREVNESAYNHEYLGHDNTEGSMIFPNVVLREITDEEISRFENPAMGKDFGWFPDPLVWVKTYYDPARLTLYIYDEYRTWKTSNRDVYEYLVKEKNVNPNDLIIGDSASPKDIADFCNMGLYMIGAEKGADSLKYSYKWLQSLKAIVIDNVRAPETAKEFLEAEFERDKNGDIITTYPDKNNHGIDAVRYSQNLVWRQGGQ
jgi:PBSX family phage terminase large subunit